MKNICKNICNNSSGTMFVILALLLPVVFFIGLLTIDLGQMQYAESNNAAATDSAAASVADYVGRARIEKTEPTPDEMRNYALQIMNSNVSDQNVGIIIPDRFTVALVENTVTVNSCMLVKGTSFSKITSNGDSHTVCSQGSANLLCIVQEVKTEEPCPMGQTGTIQYVATTQCPSGILGEPMPVSNTCKSDCTPNTTSETKPCPEGTVGAGITMTTSKSCPSGELTTTQTSYACEKPCEQKNETKVDQCSVVLNNSKAVGTITKMRTSICPSGAWGEWLQTKYECCIPEVEERDKDCPAGETGTITQERTKSCPSATWSDWKNVSNTCKAPPACKVGDAECTCGKHPRWWFNMAAYNSNDPAAKEFLCGKCAPGMTASGTSAAGCMFSGMTKYPKTVAGDIVCAIRADGNNGSMIVTPANYPQGCNEPLYKDLADTACIKWINGHKLDISNAASGTCKASQYPDSNPKTKAGDTICVRYKNGTMVVSPAGKPNGCNNS